MHIKNILLITGLPMFVAAMAVGPLEAQRVQEDKAVAAVPQVRILNQQAVIGAAVTNGKAGDELATLGQIADLVFDFETGEACHAILSSGGTLGLGKKTTPIAWNLFAWTPKESHFSLSMTPKEIEALPDFDQENVSKLCASTADAASTVGGVVRAAGDARRGTGSVASAASGKVAPHHCTLVSSIAGCEVSAGDDNLGAGGTVLIEPDSGSLAFLSLSVGGVIGIGDSTYILPWKALSLVQAEDMEEFRIQIVKSKDQIKTAPKLEDKGADPSNVAFRMTVYKFYGVVTPDFEIKAIDGSKDR
jgi:hypothetical protein